MANPLTKVLEAIGFLKPRIKISHDRVDMLLKLRKQQMQSQRRGEVRVGYRTRYAIYVHEDLTQRHQPGKEGKYLQKPFRQMISSKELMLIIGLHVNSGAGLKYGMLKAGEKVRDRSLMIVPVDTGKLRDSVFVESKN